MNDDTQYFCEFARLDTIVRVEQAVQGNEEMSSGRMRFFCAWTMRE